MITPSDAPFGAGAPAVVAASSLKSSIKVEQLTCTIGAELSNVNLGVASRDPALGEWAARVSAARDTHSADPRPQPARAPAPRDASPPRMNPSMALTPKERRVLELLARNLSNKEIAMAMQIGEETIKWHLKNVFGKLAAGSRKQVVRRAHLLGLLESGA